MKAAHFLRASLFALLVLLFSGKFVSVRASEIAQFVPRPIVLPVASPVPTAIPASTPVPKGYLLQYLDTIGEPELTPLTFISYLIHTAVDRGISVNTIVFLLLFPLIASLVAFSRHVIGLTGFSIYAPAALSVVLLSTGIAQGILLFFLMLFVASLGKWLITYMKLEYIPRTAMLLLFVALGMFFVLLLSTVLPVSFFMRVDMFPLLILVLLAEDFMGTQAGHRWQLAIERALQIMALAAIGAVIMGNPSVQRLVLSKPEFVILGVAVFNFLVGRYLGLRLTEYFRFRPIIDTEE